MYLLIHTYIYFKNFGRKTSIPGGDYYLGTFNAEMSFLVWLNAHNVTICDLG